MQFVISDGKEQDFLKLIERSGVPSPDDLISLAMVLVDWAVTVREEGHWISSINKEEQTVMIFRTAMLDAIEPVRISPSVPRFKLIQGDRKD